MLDRASSVVCSRSTSLRRDVDLAGPGACAEALNEVVELRDFLLALRVVGFDPGANLRFRHHHVVVAAGIRDDRLVVDVGDMRADRVQEMPVVRDDDQRALVTVEELFEPVNRVEVEVVRGLVEQQRFGMTEKRLREQHAHLLAALQLGHLSSVQLIRDVETLKQNRGVALGGVAVFFADDALELAEAHAGLVRHLRLAVELVALEQRIPQATVAHDDRVDDAMLVERVLILPEHAELFGPCYGALLSIELAREQFHERRLAGPIRARQAVPPARRKRGGDFLEECPRAETHGDAAY